MTRITRKTRTTTEQKLFWALVSTMVLFVALYVYFISSSVVNVVLHKEAQQEQAAISSRLATLESEYLARKNDIDLDLASSLGFIEIDQIDKQFVTRTVRTSLTLNQ